MNRWHDVKYHIKMLLSIACHAAGSVLAITAMVYVLCHPELTNMQLFSQKWPLVIGSLASLIVGRILLFAARL